jgi:hypothetical protein
MAKTFNTEQLRLAGLLLTGNPTDGANGTLWYNNQKLAIGSNAAEQGRQLLPGSGLYGKQNGVELFETASLKGNANDPDYADLQTDLEFHISGRSGISVHPDFLWIDKLAIENAQLETEGKLGVQAGNGLNGGSSAHNGGSPLLLGASTTLNVTVDDASVEVGSTNNDIKLKDGVNDGTAMGSTTRAAAGIQSSHLDSVDWAKGAGPGGDALAVEHNLQSALHTVMTDLDGTNTTAFDGGANMSFNVKTEGANLVVISGERQHSNWDGDNDVPNSNHYLQVIGGAKEWQDDATFKGDVVIDGAITVQGDVIQVDSNHVNIGDNIIVLNSDLAVTATPQNGGVDVRIGTLEGTAAGLLGGPARIWFDTTARAWQAGNVKNWGGTEDVTDMWNIHTQKYSRTFTVPCVKDQDYLSNAQNAAGDYIVDWAKAIDTSATEGTYEFNSIPNVVASLTYTGSVAEPEHVSWVIKDVTTSGCKIDFSDGVPHTMTDMKLYVSTL